MLKTLCYIEDRGVFELISVSESGRLATKVQDPFAAIPEVQDFEKFLQARLDANLPRTKTEGLAELIADVHQYNNTVSDYERVRYLKTVTPQLVNMLNTARLACDSRFTARMQQNHKTFIDVELKVVKVEKDGE
jgi:hypothetical protein